MNWLAVFKREMLVLKKKIAKPGYVLASMFYPVIYLFAFGLGLGKVVQVEGGYGAFLCAGMAGISVMTNSFQQTSVSLSYGKTYLKTFQSLIVSPVPIGQVALGIMFAGVFRGMLSSLMIYSIGSLFFGGWQLNWVGLTGLLLGAIVFSAFGTVAGMWASNESDLSVIQNFFITPMIFFSGSFFPIDNFPWLLAGIVRILPLGMVNQLLHAKNLSFYQWINMGGLLVIGIFLWWLGTCLIERYEE